MTFLMKVGTTIESHSHFPETINCTQHRDCELCAVSFSSRGI